MQKQGQILLGNLFSKWTELKARQAQVQVKATHITGIRPIGTSIKEM